MVETMRRLAGKDIEPTICMVGSVMEEVGDAFGVDLASTGSNLNWCLLWMLR